METESLPRTKKEAKLLGAVAFYTGKPCKFGHTAKRYTQSGCCYPCIAEKNARWKKEKSADPAWLEEHRQRRAVGTKKYYEKTAEIQKANSREYSKRRRAEDHEWAAKWAKNSREWQKANPKKVNLITRRYHLKSAYGITPEEFDAMLAAQGGKCANEGCTATSGGGKHNSWSVDHNHTTGKVRGLLCTKCNSSLGYLEESEEKIMGLINYLRKYN